MEKGESSKGIKISEMFEWSSSNDDHTDDEQTDFDPISVKLEVDDETIATQKGEDMETCTQNEGSYVVPSIGLTFLGEDQAYNFYNEYARKVGFSIKKYLLERRKDGSLKYQKLACNKQGTKQIRKDHVCKKSLLDTRTNCMASVEFKIDRNDVWTIKKFELNHNHPMTSPNKIHMLRSHRRILPYQRSLIDQMTESGIKAHHVYNYFQSGGANSDIGFIRDDSTNYIQRSRRKKLDGKETRGILRFLKDRRASDPSFFSAMETSNSGEITHFFLCDGRSIIDFSYFGDVVCFDTTFQTNEYDMPFAPIVGLNHHKQTIIFGAALLYDESADSSLRDK